MATANKLHNFIARKVRYCRVNYNTVDFHLEHVLAFKPIQNSGLKKFKMSNPRQKTPHCFLLEVNRQQQKVYGDFHAMPHISEALELVS